MASLRRTYDQSFGAGSLLLSLGLHLALVTFVLIAGWHKPRVAPTVMEVSLVAPSGDDSAAPGKPSSPDDLKTGPAAKVKPAPLPQVAIKAAEKPVAPPTKKRRERVTPPPPAPQGKTETPQPRPTPPSVTLTDLPAPPSRSSFITSENNKASSSGAGRGAPHDARETLGSGSGGGAGKGRGGQGNKGGGSGGLVAAQNQYLGLIRARILAHRHYPPLARARHMEGVVRLRFTLTQSGALSRGVQVVKPSGFSILDEQASQCVLAAAPFPPFPPELNRDSLIVEVPIVYRLKDWSG